jgi:PDZ domain-containing protein
MGLTLISLIGSTNSGLNKSTTSRLEPGLEYVIKSGLAVGLRKARFFWRKVNLVIKRGSMRFRLKPNKSSLALALLVTAGLIKVPYVLLTPGPAFSTIGEVEGQKFISINGAQTYQTEGDLFMTTVSEFGGPSEGIDVFQAIWGWLSPTQEVSPREAYYDESVTEEENRAQNVEAFSTSQTYAVGAALKHLDLPVLENVVVSSITEGTPAAGLLKAGDRIVSVDGISAATPKEVANLVRKRPVGSVLNFQIVRNGNELTIQVTSAAREDDPGTEEDEDGLPYVGIGLDMQYQANFTIDFAQTGIGGPSAGMMFSLGIVDLLTPGALTQGKQIAGTGTIDGDGNVGPIGGIVHKLQGAKNVGATLFLAPKLNCDEVVGNIPDGLTVVPVESLTTAVTAINDYNAGKSLPVCEAQK